MENTANEADGELAQIPHDQTLRTEDGLILRRFVEGLQMFCHLEILPGQDFLFGRSSPGEREKRFYLGTARAD